MRLVRRAVIMLNRCGVLLLLAMLLLVFFLAMLRGTHEAETGDAREEGFRTALAALVGGALLGRCGGQLRHAAIESLLRVVRRGLLLRL